MKLHLPPTAVFVFHRFLFQLFAYWATASLIRSLYKQHPAPSQSQGRWVGLWQAALLRG